MMRLNQILKMERYCTPCLHQHDNIFSIWLQTVICIQIFYLVMLSPLNREPLNRMLRKAAS